MTAEATPPRKGRGGRPKGDPSAVRASTIGVRVSAEEYAALRAKAEQMGASRKAIDQDLRSLLVRLPSQERQRICDYLIAEDPERFAWLLGRRESRERGQGQVTKARLA